MSDTLILAVDTSTRASIVVLGAAEPIVVSRRDVQVVVTGVQIDRLDARIDHVAETGLRYGGHAQFDVDVADGLCGVVQDVAAAGFVAFDQNVYTSHWRDGIPLGLTARTDG